MCLGSQGIEIFEWLDYLQCSSNLVFSRLALPLHLIKQVFCAVLADISSLSDASPHFSGGMR